jgi:hypothetical protein
MRLEEGEHKHENISTICSSIRKKKMYIQRIPDRYIIYALSTSVASENGLENLALTL